MFVYVCLSLCAVCPWIVLVLSKGRIQNLHEIRLLLTFRLYSARKIQFQYITLYINSRIVFLFLTKLRLYFFTGCTQKDENHEIRLNLNSSVSEIKDIKFKHILCPSEQIFYPPFSPECFHPLVNLTCRRPYSRQRPRCSPSLLLLYIRHCPSHRDERPLERVVILQLLHVVARHRVTLLLGVEVF